MRWFGVLLWVVAGLCFLGALGMDTSVPTGTGSRVHNIGLMHAQENALLLGIGFFIAGAIFIGLGGKKSAQSAPEQDSGDIADTKKCPFCAEAIKSDAILCRFCGKDLPQVAVAPQPIGGTGLCAYCSTEIALDSKECPKCKAQVGPNSIYPKATRREDQWFA